MHWMDLGTLRQGTGNWGEATGPMFEALGVAEARKWIDSRGRDTPLWFHRTRSGREVDLLVTTPAGIIGLEIKNRTRVAAADGSGLSALSEALGPEWLGGLVAYRGEDLRELRPGIWTMPVQRLL